MRSAIALLAALLLSLAAPRAFALGIDTNPKAPEIELAAPAAGHPAGIILTKIYPGSAAEKAGLQVGDIVTRINGSRITRMIEWSGAFESNGGKTIELTVFRDHQQVTLSLAVPLFVAPVRISGKDPKFPFKAKMEHTSGMVLLNAVISKEGRILSLTPVSGPEILRKAALDAVKKWKFKPATKDGQPIEAQIGLSVDFSLEPRAGK